MSLKSSVTSAFVWNVVTSVLYSRPTDMSLHVFQETKGIFVSGTEMSLRLQNGIPEQATNSVQHNAS